SALRVPVPTSRGDGCALPPASRKCLPKLAAELLVAIMQQVTTAVQISGVLHRCVARHLLHPARVRMAGDAAQGYATAAHFNEEQHVVGHNPRQVSTSTVKKSAPTSTSMCDLMNSFHVVVRLRSGAGATSCRRKILPTVWSETGYPRLASAPTMRSYPQPRFSRANRTTRASTSGEIRGRPG